MTVPERHLIYMYIYFLALCYYFNLFVCLAIDLMRKSVLDFLGLGYVIINFSYPPFLSFYSYIIHSYIKYIYII